MEKGRGGKLEEEPEKKRRKYIPGEQVTKPSTPSTVQNIPQQTRVVINPSSTPARIPTQPSSLTQPRTVQNIPQQTQVVINPSNIPARIPTQPSSSKPFPVYLWTPTIPQANNLASATKTKSVTVRLGNPKTVMLMPTAASSVAKQSSVTESIGIAKSGEMHKSAQDKTAEKRDNSKGKSSSHNAARKDKASQKGAKKKKKRDKSKSIGIAKSGEMYKSAQDKTAEKRDNFKGKSSSHNAARKDKASVRHKAMKSDKVKGKSRSSDHKTSKSDLAGAKRSSSGLKSAREGRAGVKSKIARSAAENIPDVPSPSDSGSSNHASNAGAPPVKLQESDPETESDSESSNQASNAEAPRAKQKKWHAEMTNDEMTNDELFDDTFVNYLYDYRYTPFLKRLYYNRIKARRVAQQFVIKDMVTELQHFVDRKTPSVWKSKTKKFDSARTFSWEAAERQAEERCPLLYAVLAGAMGKERKKRRHVREGRKVSNHIALIFGLLNHMCPRRNYFNVLQEIISLELFLGGCSKKVMNRLSELGLCLRPSILQHFVTQVLTQNKIDIHAKIKQVETVCSRTQGGPQEVPQEEPQEIPQEQPQEENEEAQWNPAGTRTSRVQTKKGEAWKDPTTDSGKEDVLKKDKGICQSVDELSSERRMIEDKNHGYSLSFGEVPTIAMSIVTGQTLTRKHGTMVHTFLAVDRIPSMHLGEEVSPTVKFRIVPEKFVIRSHEAVRIQTEYMAMVKRILVKRLPCFELCTIGEIDYHLTHKYSEQSSKKSVIIPLGITHIVNEVSKREEMADILDTVHKQVPVTEQTGPVRTILGCKPAMIKRVRDAQKARGTGEGQCDRLEGLYLPPQEWQKHGAYIQETYRQLYDPRSCNDTGTLSNIRDWYPDNTFTDVRLETTDNAATLLRFATEAYVVAAACTILSSTDQSGVLKLKSEKAAKSARTLQNVAASVVKMVSPWHEGKPKKKKVITESPEEGLYCICRTDEEDELMVQCDNGSCKRGSWFHLSCLDLDSDDLPEADWFCSTECEAETRCDYVHEYSRALLYRGLGEMVRNDAMCENDGRRMNIHWKCDMVDFFRSQQTEMFEEGFAYLTATMGVASPRVAHQLQWNRTVNVSGEAGGNVPLDRYMEIMDAEYEDTIRNAAITHMYPSKGLRISQLLGLRRNIEDNLDQSMLFESEISKKKEKKKIQDILEMAKRLLDHRCLDVIPGRSHEGFPKFRSRTHFDPIDDYMEEITKRCEEWKRDDVPA